MQGGAAKRQVRVSIAPNPSHLEAVNAVVAGLVRAEQSRLPLARRSQVRRVDVSASIAVSSSPTDECPQDVKVHDERS